MDLLQERTFVALAVGNTRTRVGLFERGELRDATSVPNTDPRAIVEACRAHALERHGLQAIVATVHREMAAQIAQQLRGVLDDEVVWIGKDVPIPLTHTLDDASTLGQDRALCALAAYARAKQACVIVDAGTAITVDFVDGEGTFHGGVIAPGLNLMLASLHEHTSALPALIYSPPLPSPFGKDTRHAMLLGAQAAARGLVRFQLDAYAEFYEAYPQLIVTGGDAPQLFGDDPLVDHIVPDLQLLGIAEALSRMMADDEHEGPGSGSHARPDDEDDAEA
jgi:type III pantothenate kinase